MNEDKVIKSKDAVDAPPIDIGLPKSGLTKGKKAFDIVPQDKTMPSRSSKPVIVGSRIVVKDPMMTDGVSGVSDDKVELKSPSASRVAIKPLNDNSDEPAESLGSEVDEPDNAISDSLNDSDSNIETDSEPAEVPDSDSSDLPESTDKKDENDETKDDSKSEMVAASDKQPSSEVDVLSEDIKKSTEIKAEDLEKAKIRQREEDAELLIASKQYFVPINAVKKRKSLRIVIGMVVVTVLILVALALLDAGYINVISAPTDFIAD